MLTGLVPASPLVAAGLLVVSPLLPPGLVEVEGLGVLWAPGDAVALSLGTLLLAALFYLFDVPILRVFGG